MPSATNEVKLPDDKNKSIYWEEKLSKPHPSIASPQHHTVIIPVLGSVFVIVLRIFLC
jgi:hypothetical protein